MSEVYSGHPVFFRMLLLLASVGCRWKNWSVSFDGHGEWDRQEGPILLPATEHAGHPHAGNSERRSTP